MKNRIMKNLWLKLLALVVAFIVWLVIINITDPTISRQFTDIPVDILNENVITSANQVYEVESGKTVDVTVKGKRSFIEELAEEDFYASADLSKLSTVNTAGIQVKLNKTMRCSGFHWRKETASNLKYRSPQRENWQNPMCWEKLLLNRI